MMKPGILWITVILVLAAGRLSGQDQLPVPAAPSSWVNDYAEVFSRQEREQLEQKLGALEYRTSTQIFVVTIEDNQGYPASMLAPMIGEAWKVGQAEEDNGALILVDMGERDVFISTGYGLEEYIPDAIAKRIVENEIIPGFKQGNYYQGIDAAINVMTDLLDGKFTSDEYMKQSSSGSVFSIGGIIFMIILFWIIFGSRRRSVGMGRSNLPLWLALGMLSGNRSSGSWGSFSSGSGGFGGGGGFSGGGGGSFGGGGAGGSW